MSGVNQVVFMNQRSFGPPAIGSAYEGGFFAGQISTSANGVATHNLVVAPIASGQSSTTGLQYKGSNTAVPGADSTIDGPQNTADMVADGSSGVYPAAHFCNNLVIGGYDDWYMPALDELEICYYNLKPTTQSNDTSYGTNAYSVPSRASTFYTAGTPAQTTSSAFQENGLSTQDFAISRAYWSSTETAGNVFNAWNISFSAGIQLGTQKIQSRIVRAVRRVPV